MKTASLFLFVLLAATAGAQASTSGMPTLRMPNSTVPTLARPDAGMLQTGFPATRCKNIRLSETQRRHCDKAMKKAASKGLTRGV